MKTRHCDECKQQGLFFFRRDEMQQRPQASLLPITPPYEHRLGLQAQMRRLCPEGSQMKYEPTLVETPRQTELRQAASHCRNHSCRCLLFCFGRQLRSAVHQERWNVCRGALQVKSGPQPVQQLFEPMELQPEYRATGRTRPVSGSAAIQAAAKLQRLPERQLRKQSPA